MSKKSSQQQLSQHHQSEPVEYLYKILVVGDIGVGKTSIIKQYVHSIFSQSYKSTIGVDFALKVLQWDNNTIIRLQLWDIAGQERFGNMTRVYYKEAVGAMVVYDITRPSTFDAVQKWKADIESKVFLPDERHSERHIPCVLLANKCDLANSMNKAPEDMNQYCQENGFIGWFETSAKDNKNIDTAARFLVEKILENHVEITKQQNPDTFTLDQGGMSNGTSNGAAAEASKGACGCSR